VVSLIAAREFRNPNAPAVKREAEEDLGTVTDLLLRQAQASRAGAQGDDDYDVHRY
jgi:hypothetical protein